MLLGFYQNKEPSRRISLLKCKIVELKRSKHYKVTHT